MKARPKEAPAPPTRDVEERAIDRKLPTPLYEQIEDILLGQIRVGAYPEGTLLPAVRLLCQQFGGVNHLTVRQAIRQLENRGLVRPIQGRGVMVLGETENGGTGLHRRRKALLKVAIVIPTLEVEMPLRITQSIQRVVAERGVQTVILDSRADCQQELENIKHLQDLALDGAIIFPVPFGDINERIVRLQIDGFPFVLVDRHLDDIQTFAVMADHYKGSYEITRHLVAAGRRAIAWIGQTNVSSTRLRYSGLREALNDSGLIFCKAMQKDLVTPTPTFPIEEAVCKLVAELMSERSRPDAIVFQNDSAALTGLAELKRLGIRVPNDVSVVGFDDEKRAAESDPPLTTVSQPMEAIGMEALDLLIQKINDKTLAPRRILLPVNLIIRASS